MKEINFPIGLLSRFFSKFCVFDPENYKKKMKKYIQT